MEINKKNGRVTISFDRLIEDETGIYGVDFRDHDSAPDYRTYLLDPNVLIPIADTSDTQKWPKFYRRGWSKPELRQGHRDAWNLPTGAEAEKKFWGED